MTTRLSSKIALTVAATLVALTSIVYLWSASFVSHGIREVEREIALHNVQQVRQAIEERTRHLSALAADYSVWDDSYNYIQSPNSAFVSRNLNQTLVVGVMGANLVAYLDLTGKVVASVAYDLETKAKIPPAFPEGSRAPLPELLEHAAGPLDEVRGIMVIENKPMLVASRPIFHSDGSGTCQGFVVVASYLDERQVEAISRTTHLEMATRLYGDDAPGFEGSAGGAPCEPPTEPPVSGSVLTCPGEHDLLLAYTTLPDLAQQPALWLRVEMPRTFYLRQESMLRYFAASLIAVGILLALVNIFVLRRVVVSRLLGLSKKVVQIGANSRLSERVSCSGDDELSDLAAQINTMLASLERAESDLEMAKAKAEESNQAKSEFLANMSHEIRTPMNGVLGMTNILLQLKLDPEQHEIARNIERSAESLLSVINDILDYTRAEAGKVVLEPVLFKVRDLLDEVSNLHGPLASRKSVRLIIRCSPSVPRLVIGDPDRIRQVMTNLVGNAVKFTQEGQIKIDVDIESRNDLVAALRFAVTDTGMGIAPDQIQRIFHRFEQAESSVNRRFGGSGLGLAISQRMVELMGGSMEATSKEGQGSTFSFIIPIPHEFEADRPEVIPVDFSGLRILIVDENADGRNVLLEQVAVWKVRSGAAASGPEAVRALEEAISAGDPYRAILFVHPLRGDEGPVLARVLKTDPGFAELDCILISPAMEPIQCEEIDALKWAARIPGPPSPSRLLNSLVETWAARSGQSMVKHPPSEGPVYGSASDEDSAAPWDGVPRVLLVEDNLMNQKVAQHHLTSFGCIVDTANNGEEAVEAARRFPYDLIMMDWLMPVMDGIEATAKIRSQEGKDRHAPIVAMTANAMEGDRERCLAAGMDDYVSKPLRREVLLQVMARQLRPASPDPSVTGDTEGGQTSPKIPSTFTKHPELLNDLIQIFLRDAPHYIGELDKAVAEKDPEKITFYAHSLKGMAGTLEIQDLHHAFFKLQEMGRSHDLMDVESLWAETRTRYIRVVEELQGSLSPPEDGGAQDNADDEMKEAA